MNHKKSVHPRLYLSVFISLLILGFSWAVYVVGSSVEGVNTFTTNVVQTKKVKRSAAPKKILSAKSMKQLHHLRLMLAYSPLPEEIIHPSIVCYAPAVEQPAYQGEFTEREMRVTPAQGEEFFVTMYVKNSGNVPWFSDRSGCSGIQPITRLGTAREKDRASLFFYQEGSRDTGWSASNRVNLVEDRVDPGEIGTFYFISKAPERTDTYREYFQMVVEGKQWLERPEESVRLDIAVDRGATEDERRLKYIRWSANASMIDLETPRTVEIDISEQKMTVMAGDIKVREYMVSTGTFNTPTPLGTGKIANKQELRIASAKPHYRMPKWQGLAFDRHGGKFLGFGLHALPYLANDNGVFWNEALSHIGQRVSHGCVRLLNEDAADLYELTEIGDKINIHE